MSSASELFQTLSKFQNSEAEFLEYCQQFLGPVERVHFDFKEKQDRRVSSLGESDKKNLAKAVSGFANSGGGVLIWGIKDEILDEKPIGDIQKFVSNLLSLASKTTEPFVPDIDGAWISNDGVTGYALIHIPESTLPPHRVALKGDIQHHYYIRTASSFEVATHTMLEDMFGRRPKPNLSLVVSIPKEVAPGPYIVVGLENSGRGLARSPYIAFSINAPYVISPFGVDGNGNFGLRRLPPTFGIYENRFGSFGDFVVHSSVIHNVAAIELQMFYAEQRIQRKWDFVDLVIDYEIAAEGLNLFRGQKTVSSDELRNKEVKKR